MQARLRLSRLNEEKKEEILKRCAARAAEDQRVREQKEHLAQEMLAQEAQLIARLRGIHQSKRSALKGLAVAVRDSLLSSNMHNNQKSVRD